MSDVDNLLKVHTELIRKSKLSKEIRYLIALAVAVSLGCHECAEEYANHAEKLGIGREEILDASLTALLVTCMKCSHVANLNPLNINEKFN